MSKKKTKIVSILQSNSTFEPSAVFFPVAGHPQNNNGDVCANDNGDPIFPIVKSIVFCRHAYGQGAAVDQPCYVVSFEDSNQVVIIPATQFCQLTVQTIDPVTEDTVPGLPE
jgi:hypothetical protein